jgi:hypothetical protein
MSERAPTDSDSSFCKRCGAAIRWVLALDMETFTPLDRAPVASGPWAIEETGNGPAIVPQQHATGDLFGQPLRYVSHWSTCKDASEVKRDAAEPRFEGRGPGRTP